MRFSSTAYVLPRTGQRGIPVISVNTKTVAVEIYRISDRNLVDAIAGVTSYDRGDFQRSLDRSDIEQLKESRGVQVWKGDLAVDSAPINQDVTTAFPVDQAVGDLKPGVYVMVAQPQELKNIDSNYDALATQWFIVSDLGLAAFSGNDGIHAFVNSLATTDAKSGVEVRLISRSNEVLATRRTDAGGHVQFEAGLASGEGGTTPTLIAANDGQGDFAFLNLTGPAFDLTDRGVSGRPAPNGLDAFVYAERGVYRSGETAYLTALLRDTQGAASAGVPLTFVVERPDGVEYRRTLVADQGLGGHGLTLPIAASAPTGTWHVHVFTDPKRAAVGETTFLVEDYVPERIEFDLSSPSGTISKTNPATINLAGRFLYGAPASALDLEGDLNIAVAAERSGFAGYQFGLDGEDVAAVQQPLDSLPSTDDAGKATFKVDIDKLPSSTHPLEARIAVRMAEPGGRAVEHKITLPVTASGNMIGVKPLFIGRSLAEGASAAFDVVVVAPNGTAVATKGLHYELLRVETHYQFYKRDGSWHFEPVKTTSRLVRWRDRHRDRQAGPYRAAGEFRPLPAQCHLARAERPDHVGDVRCRLVCRRQRRHAGHAGNRARQERVPARRHHDGRRHRAQRRASHAQCHRRQAAGEPKRRREAGRRYAKSKCRSAPIGALAPISSPPCAGRSMRRRNACPAAPSACSGSPSTARRRRSLSISNRRRCCGRTPRCTSRSRSTGSKPATRRGSRLPRSMSASSISPTTSRRRRTITISASARCRRKSAISTAI